MPKRILGTGWAFPVSIDKHDAICLSHHEKKIAESILIILGTAKGERIMRPDFGCDIHDFAFSIVNTSVITQIKSAVKEALILWEPRIEVMTIHASTETLSEGFIGIDIHYRVRYTNTAHNLVFPFYLESEIR